MRSRRLPHFVILLALRAAIFATTMSRPVLPLLLALFPPFDTTGLPVRGAITGENGGFCPGLAIATCVGPYAFTRIGRAEERVDRHFLSLCNHSYSYAGYRKPASPTPFESHPAG